MASDMLSPHFSLPEFVKSQMALRHGIRNDPTPEHRAALKLLCVKVLEPVRTHYGKPVRITSGYRSAALNRAVGGATSSQHSKGEAADFEVPGVSNLEVARWVRDNLNFDQLILEFYTPGQPNSGWIHVSYREPPRKQALTTSDGVRYLSGLIA